MYNYYRVDPTVVSFAKGDVTGDKVPDNVYLTGTKTPDSPFIQHITLVVQDGRTGRHQSVNLSENAGYDPTLFLGDFTGDGADDILIRIQSGGSGAFTFDYVYSFVNNNPQLLFDFQTYNDRFQYDVNYQDNYKVKVVSKSNQLTYLIDISLRDPEYLNEIYEANGKLISPIEGFVNPLSGLYPVDFDSNGVYELLAYQKVAGRYNADALGYVLNTLAWKNDRFVLQNQNIAIDGY
ncbi:VCBS repeat-containing protein [Fictibacillus phosphorivorans]|uniref:VCBS repeat-containing protein n=1 Tax=Fictibacillus phosphorivorans TaxID=1221500 RepID=UPI002041F875|nr:VCBS repeat-containing protein [Fictibacillus phosphorivorans]MCM3719493.1 VCBS repeat-containing protein [Fictibacillus phosphorivorans]MCM3777184.1 VCBS repeat-containing protein [Fictibacillus phosphorivorans]